MSTSTSILVYDHVLLKVKESEVWVPWLTLACRRCRQHFSDVGGGHLRRIILIKWSRSKDVGHLDTCEWFVGFNLLNWSL